MWKKHNMSVLNRPQEVCECNDQYPVDKYRTDNAHRRNAQDITAEYYLEHWVLTAVNYREYSFLRCDAV
jgi:hypothetical protein